MLTGTHTKHTPYNEGCFAPHVPQIFSTHTNTPCKQHCLTIFLQGEYIGTSGKPPYTDAETIIRFFILGLSPLFFLLDFFVGSDILACVVKQLPQVQRLLPCLATSTCV